MIRELCSVIYREIAGNSGNRQDSPGKRLGGFPSEKGFFAKAPCFLLVF